jgi:hypothetical protein
MNWRCRKPASGLLYAFNPIRVTDAMRAQGKVARKNRHLACKGKTITAACGQYGDQK